MTFLNGKRSNGFFGVAEKLNWGQHIFHVQPSPPIADLNVGPEMNVLNLKCWNPYSPGGQLLHFSDNLNAT